MDFHRFLVDLGTPFGTSFGSPGSFFKGLVDPNSGIGFQVAFYNAPEWKSSRNPMVGFAETIINIYVFARFHFLVFCEMDYF